MITKTNNLKPRTYHVCVARHISKELIRIAKTLGSTNDHDHVGKYSLTDIVKDSMDSDEDLQNFLKMGYTIHNAKFDGDDDFEDASINLTLIHLPSEHEKFNADVAELAKRGEVLGAKITVHWGLA